MSNFNSTQFRGNLSIQSCFPEIKSSTNSSLKSFGDADANSISVECSDDELSLKDAFHSRPSYCQIYQGSFYVSGSASLNHKLQRQWSSPCLTFHESPSNNPQPEQDDLTPIEFSAADGNGAHVSLDPSIWPLDSPINQNRSVPVEQNAEEAYSTVNFQHPAVFDTGTYISGDYFIRRNVLYFVEWNQRENKLSHEQTLI